MKCVQVDVLATELVAVSKHSIESMHYGDIQPDEVAVVAAHASIVSQSIVGKALE